MDNMRTEDEIISQWNTDTSHPLVSICCLTFNHVNFIEDALRGFLAQETRFPYEIVIHDDASTDGTDKLVRDYEKKYPTIIKAIYQTENQYSQGKKSEIIAVAKCRGKYVAMCDGDDYWSDERKLQIQADYLEAHPDVVISGHDAIVVDDKKNLLKKSKLPASQKRDFTGRELSLDKALVLNVSWMFRNIDMEYIPEREHVVNGDNFMLSLLGLHGGSHHHDDIKPAAHRVHAKGVWSGINREKKAQSHAVTYYWISRHYNRIGRHDLAHHFIRKSSFTLLTSLDSIGFLEIVKFNAMVMKLVFRRKLPNVFQKLFFIKSRRAGATSSNEEENLESASLKSRNGV